MSETLDWMFNKLSEEYADADERLFNLENLIAALQERAAVIRSERDTAHAALHILMENA